MPRDIIRQACNVLFVPGQVVEVRALGRRGSASGYFDQFDLLADRADALDRGGEYDGVYVTINPVNPALLSRRVNRIEGRLGTRETTTSDRDITRRSWLPVDIDPVRPSGVSSSDAEHEAALAKAREVASFLSGLDWPDPVMADSGNGAHLLYRIDLPVDDASRALVKGVLETLDLIFSDEVCRVDTANFNAGRIWKLYGTWSRKGDTTRDRPHRVSRILSVPEPVRLVSPDLLSRLAAMIPPAETVRPSGKDRKMGRRIELSDWLHSHGIGYRNKPFAGGDCYVLDACPFSSDHTDGAYCIQFANGAIFAGCHHSSCGGGTQRWAELRERFEGTIEERMKRLKQRRRERDRPDPVIQPVPVEETVTGAEAEAEQIIRSGDPLSFMLDTFALDHIGDPVVAWCLVMSLASRLVLNAKGLHVSVSGESGKGKSHAFDTMMQQVPIDLRLEGRMSDKALFYIKGMQPGSVIALDDVTLSDPLQEVLKGVTTSFKRPFVYRTVNKDQKGQVCVIPERCVWWIAKVEGTGDDQVWNRMLSCWIDDSPEQDAKVLARILEDAARSPGEMQGERHEVRVCQEIWQRLSAVHVVVPYARKIRFSSDANRRNPDMLLDLVKCHAALMQHQRERVESGEMVAVTATVTDFTEANRLFCSLNGVSGGQQSKLTRKEAELVEAIRTRGQGEITISEMQHLTGWSHSVLYKMLHGYQTRGNQYSGLLEKCPAISVCDRTVMTDENGSSSSYRRCKAYSWDPYVYDCWDADGGCWLDESDGDDRGDDDRPSLGDGCGGMAAGCGVLAEGAATNPAAIAGPDPDSLSNSQYSCTCGGKDDHTEAGDDRHGDDCSCGCVPDFSATRDPGSPSERIGGSDLQTEALGCCGSFRNTAAKPFDLPQQGQGSAKAGLAKDRDLPVIHSRDYALITDRNGTGPCDCCGYKWVNYQERMTRERLKEAPRPNRKICKKCFQIAKDAGIAPIRALPGVLNISRMERVFKDLGRCQVCNGGKAVWSDREDHVNICESCYHNHAGEAATV